jgi:crotonobetainyl-CoA:carnitine CoA-transferase CaiB-like acyl-CoA transferase
LFKDAAASLNAQPGDHRMPVSGRPAFHGLRVLDFSRVIAGPACTQTLADFGAEVIKIENPKGGEDGRHVAGPSHGGESHFYLAFNRGKKSVALDVTKPEGRELALQLADQSDIVIENFRPGVARRLGIDYATLAARNPRLIYLSVSAYGQEGPFSDRPGFDPVLQAESGMMSITGPEEGPPMRHPLSIIDTFTSLHATTAIATALYSREQSGKGQYVELALFDVAMAAMANAAMYYLTSGEEPPRTGNAHGTAVPVNVFPAKDGPLYMALGNQRLWLDLCSVLERPDLAEDARFATMAARSQNRAELYAVLDGIFVKETREFWSERLRSLPAGPVQGVAEALEGEAVASRGIVQTVDHPHGPLRQLASAYRFSETPVQDTHRAPLLGEHTADVLTDLCGADERRLEELRQQGVIA